MAIAINDATVHFSRWTVGEYRLPNHTVVVARGLWQELPLHRDACPNQKTCPTPSQSIHFHLFDLKDSHRQGLSHVGTVVHLCAMNAKIHTDQGSMTVEFFEKDAPKTVANFVKLSQEGFYEGLKFHRVIPGFVAQGGCPQGIGSGGPGYTIDCELDGENQYHDKGVLSMAHAGRNTGGSQFFIVHGRENTAHLDRNHTCFGKVTEGLDIVDQIKQGDTFRVEIIEG